MNGLIKLLSSDEILGTTYPEPVWAVPGILPVGLSFLAGAPKLGKSWLALQIAKGVGSGGEVLGHLVQQGPVLYLALEDSASRLKFRMQKQGWTPGYQVDFITVGDFYDHIGDLKNGGGRKLVSLIDEVGYRLVVIDTLSRAIRGDQNDVAQMTSGLSPLQEIAQNLNVAILMIDHHHKIGGANPDPILDILGSTAKGAVADTALGLYREHGRSNAKLVVIGRDVDEQTLELRFDPRNGMWLKVGMQDAPTPQQKEILKFLQEHGISKAIEIADGLEIDRGTVSKQLGELVYKGLVVQREYARWEKAT